MKYNKERVGKHMRVTSRHVFVCGGSEIWIGGYEKFWVACDLVDERMWNRKRVVQKNWKDEYSSKRHNSWREWGGGEEP